MSTREIMEVGITLLTMLSALAMLLFYYPQVKSLSAEKPAAIVLFLVALVALATWGSIVETLVPVIGVAVLVAIFFVTLHRRRRRTIATGLMTIALVGALLNMQTTYAANSGVEIKTQKVEVRGVHQSSELTIIDTGDEAAMIEEAKALALAELKEQGFEGEVVEVRVEHQDAEAGPVGFQPAAGPEGVVVPILPIVVIIVVVIIIGWLVIKIVRACRKLPARRLPDESPPGGIPPIGLVAQTTTNNFYAASTAYSPAYEVCTETWETNDSYYGTFELSGEVTGSGTNLTMTTSGAIHYPASKSVTYGQFVKGMQPWGLTLSTNEPPPVGVTSYAKNGVATTADNTPVVVNGNSVTARDPQLPGATLRSVVEFSRDLVTWTTLLNLDLQQGQKVRIQDDSGPERAFYRFRVLTQ